MTTIEWTDVTWNPTTGCDRVSPGCDNCYALTMAGRLKAIGQEKYRTDGSPRTSGPGFGLTIHPDTLDAPLHWRKPRRVFVNSMSDLFHPDVPMDFILRVWETMIAAPTHTFQILTKRPQRMARIVSAICWEWEPDVAPRQWTPYLWPGRQQGEDHNTGEEIDWYPTEADLDGGGEVHLDNVWLGTSIENDRYTFRADHLRAAPAAVRFLSLEPLLGPLPSLDLTDIDWVIVGGESGPGARPMHPDWARDVRDRCVSTGVPFFFKQWGAWAPMLDRTEPPVVMGDRFSHVFVNPRDPWAGGAYMERLGKKAAGRELDGRTWDEMPAPIIPAR